MLFREVRSHEAEDPVGVVRIRRPYLRAVDQPVIALVLAPGLQRSEVRSRAGLRIALAPPGLARHDVRKEALLLLLGRVFEQHRPKHPDAERGEGRARIDALEFLVEHDCLGIRQPAAAICFRPCRCSPALAGHAIQPQPGVRVHEFLVASAPDDFFLHLRGPHRRWAIRLEPCAGFGAEGLDVAHCFLQMSLGSGLSPPRRPVKHAASRAIAPQRVAAGLIAEHADNMDDRENGRRRRHDRDQRPRDPLHLQAVLAGPAGHPPGKHGKPAEQRDCSKCDGPFHARRNAALSKDRQVPGRWIDLDQSPRLTDKGNVQLCAVPCLRSAEQVPAFRQGGLMSRHAALRLQPRIWLEVSLEQRGDRGQGLKRPVERHGRDHLQRGVCCKREANAAAIMLR